jgi:pilus assembly protein CpaF
MPVISNLVNKENIETTSISQGLAKHDDVYNDILNKLIHNHSKLIVDIKASVFADTKASRATKDALLGEIKTLVNQKGKRLLFDKNVMIERIKNFIFGYGILQSLITDSEISDIDFTRYNHCTVKRNGVKKFEDISFGSDKEFENFASLMIVRNGGIINADENHRRESDEQYRLRINVAIPPRNVTGTSLIIRKHRTDPYNLDDLVNLNMIDDKVRNYLKDSFSKAKRNTLMVGQGASGKTTLLRACLMECDPLNNYLVCEKDTELYMNDFPNFITQRIKKESDGGRSISLKDLVIDGLTMSVEGMVVGELVGDEVFDFLSAGYTDHSISGTAHTSGVEDTPLRLITMIETGTRNLSESVIKQIISGSIDDIVYMEKFKVKEIKRIIGYDKNNDMFLYKNILEELKGGANIDEL